MEFRDNEAIYLQIAGYVCEQILLNKWPPGERIPSVRETAVLMQVNPNTVHRGYELLQQRNIINNQRGIGFFASADALDKVITFRKEQFIREELPVFLRNMYLLKIDFEEVQELYKKLIKDHF